MHMCSASGTTCEKGGKADIAKVAKKKKKKATIGMGKH